MGSDPINAIVELVTNCDDAYLRSGNSRREKIRIEIERHRRAPTKIVVKDRAGGMSAQELQDRLGKLGGRTSGFETGAARRGLFGRGAKDIVHFGPARWESVKGGKLNFLELLFEGRFTGQAKVGTLGDAPRGRRGTEVTLSVQQQFRIPRHETLLQKLRNHYALRPLLLDAKGRDVLLADLSQERDDKVRFEPPKANLIEDRAIAIPGYEDQQMSLKLYEASEPLSEEGEDREYWRHSILITSERAAYEIFDGGKFSREPYASHLRRIYGYASVPGINELIRAFDDAQESGIASDERNPVRLVRRDRRGLVSRSDHPFVEALYTTLEGALNPHLERLKKAAEAAAGEISAEAQRRWDRAGRELAKLMDESGPGDGPGGDLPPLGLSLIPTVRVVEPGDAARVLVRYRLRENDDSSGFSPAVEIIQADEDSKHSPVAMSLEPRNGYFSRTYTVAGRENGSMSEMVVRIGTEEKRALIEWRHRPPSPVEQLEFEHARFSIKDGQERWALLLAPWDLVTETDEQAQLSISGDSSITLPRGTTTIFTHDEERDAGLCRIRVRGQGIGSRARLTATLGYDVAETELAVVSGGASGIKPDIREFDTEQRSWLEEGGRLCVNAKDPTVKRYLGPKRNGWPGQNSIPFNVMLAEIMVEAASRYKLQRSETELRDLSSLLGRHLEQIRKWLPSIHRTLVPEVDLRSARDW